MNNCIKLLGIIAATPELINNVKKVLDEVGNFPNIPTKVLNKNIMWDTFAECNGWKLQQNMFTKHCRIIDPDNIRHAWGTHEAMMKALESLPHAKDDIL